MCPAVHQAKNQRLLPWWPRAVALDASGVPSLEHKPCKIINGYLMINSGYSMINSGLQWWTTTNVSQRNIRNRSCEWPSELKTTRPSFSVHSTVKLTMFHANVPKVLPYLSLPFLFILCFCPTASGWFVLVNGGCGCWMRQTAAHSSHRSGIQLQVPRGWVGSRPSVHAGCSGLGVRMSRPLEKSSRNGSPFRFGTSKSSSTSLV